MTDAHVPEAEPAPLIEKPAGGTPDLVTNIQGILDWCARVESHEDLAIDVERASSYRYSAKAYLVQIKTQSAGILLLDPLACQLPGTFTDIMNSLPWILHASRQDLPSLSMLGLEPPALFDTEVAARLLGLPKVNLGALTEELLGVRLAKEHSSANWSKRPLPESWLDYAALDVEYLAELKDTLVHMLDEAGKTSWAHEEFAFEATFSHPEVPEEPWRALHGLGNLKSPLQLAVARSMWERRDTIARNADIAPFMVLRDKPLVAMAKASSKGREAFDKAAPKSLKHREQWWRCVREARELSRVHLPSVRARGPYPNHRSWPKRFPEVLDAYKKVREGLLTRADELHMPVENLISPGHVRHWVWNHFNSEAEHRIPHASPEQIVRELEAVGARPWQAAQATPAIIESLRGYTPVSS
ncbi:HRDC domain-containing protein [Dermabacter sp. p3-SID358]|uniref:HRDC domain-containing protein n=1 Tax=Dermabacter sp. p3-SID358 TaxID=2916114 RepID=UPI0021A4B3BE|nr:HRDC domain-containing protein [Dermabacter sp. p3-SID358]MCT1867667.1 HRDC domain-containing protein [Dermabacter sp. p3-SID358]